MKTTAAIRAEKLLGFDAGTKKVTAKVGGKGGPIIIIPPDDGGLEGGGPGDE